MRRFFYDNMATFTKIIVMKIIPICIIVIALLEGCTKADQKIVPIETYTLTGRIDASNTTLTTASIKKVLFTFAYSRINDSIETNAVLNGSLSILGYTGITNRDTLLLLTPKSIGVDTALLIANDSARRSTVRANNFSFYNGDTAQFMCTNLFIKSELNASVKSGKAFFRVGRFPKYVFVKMDSVSKR